MHPLINAIDYMEIINAQVNLQKFAILVTKKSQFDKYLSILQYTILNNIEYDSYKLDDHTTIISDFTVGIAQEKEHLFHRANVALQEARLSKKKHKMFKSDEHSKSLNKTALQRLDVYKNALHSGSIIPYFQPIFNAKDNIASLCVRKSCHRFRIFRKRAKAKLFFEF